VLSFWSTRNSDAESGVNAVIEALKDPEIIKYLESD
jgi:hypothetical protein